MEGKHILVDKLSIRCACGNELEYDFDNKLGFFVKCDNCSRKYPIDNKQRPKKDAIKSAYEAEIYLRKEEIEELKRDKEYYLDRYYE